MDGRLPERIRFAPSGADPAWPVGGASFGSRRMRRANQTNRVLTRRGLLVLTGGLVLAVTGRLLGIVELFAMGTGMVGLVAASAVYARLCPYSLRAHRQLHPPRVHAGGSSRVELAVGNGGRRRTPVLTLRDPFDGGRRWARFPLAPLRPGEEARAAYRLPTDDRGIYSLGPLEVVLTDPFGLASSGRQAAGST